MCLCAWTARERQTEPVHHDGHESLKVRQARPVFFLSLLKAQSESPNLFELFWVPLLGASSERLSTTACSRVPKDRFSFGHFTERSTAYLSRFLVDTILDPKICGSIFVYCLVLDRCRHNLFCQFTSFWCSFFTFYLFVRFLSLEKKKGHAYYHCRYHPRHHFDQDFLLCESPGRLSLAVLLLQSYIVVRSIARLFFRGLKHAAKRPPSFYSRRDISPLSKMQIYSYALLCYPSLRFMRAHRSFLCSFSCILAFLIFMLIYVPNMMGFLLFFGRHHRCGGGGGGQLPWWTFRSPPDMP